MMPAAWPIPPPTAPCSCRVRRSGSGLKPIASSVAAVPATSSASSWLNPRRSRPAVASARRRTASSSRPIASLIHDQLVPEQVHQQAVMELAVAAPLVLAHDADRPEAHLAVAADGLAVGRRRGGGDPGAAAL